MTDFVQTITNEIQVFGLTPPNLWGAFSWGDNWGYGDDLITSVEKVLGLSLSLTDALSFDSTRTLSFGSLNVDVDLSSETLQDEAGYYHGFPGNTSEAEDRISTSYTELGDSNTSWSSTSSPSTNWS